nr:MAG TPA: DNA binding protein like protein [Caudoviricetes sp.]
MGLLDRMKHEAAKSGASKGKFMYFRPDDKKRIRFLQELDDGLEIPFHDNFERGINVPCQEVFGKDCPYCEDEDLRTRSQFAFSIYDYDAKEVKILMQAVNQCSAIPALVNMAETYGTIMDRDYVLKKTGKGSTSSFTIIPMDKNKFRNEKAKPLSKKALLKYLNQAFPCDDSEDDLEDDEDDYEDSRKKPNTKKEKASEDDWEDENDASDYSDMSPKELYDLCCDRDIECQKKRPAKYYINLLKENDAAHDDWDDDEDSDEDE